MNTMSLLRMSLQIPEIWGKVLSNHRTHQAENLEIVAIRTGTNMRFLSAYFILFLLYIRQPDKFNRTLEAEIANESNTSLEQVRRAATERAKVLLK